MNTLGITNIDYIEFYVGNLFQSCLFYKNILGFTPIAHAENSIKHENSILLKQNDIYIIITSALTSHSPVAHHVHEHGDGIKDIAFLTKNAAYAFESAIKRGAKAVLEPTTIEDDNNKIIKATIATFGNTHHSFIERFNQSLNFLPLYNSYNYFPENTNIGLNAIDHIAACVEQGSLLEWRDFYQNVLNFHESRYENIRTEKSGMNSYALKNTQVRSSFSVVLVEPSCGIKKSQVKEFLDSYGVAGVQHLAFLSENILCSVQSLQDRGISFLSIPTTYYSTLHNIMDINNLPVDLKQLEKLKILIDHDKHGYLLQTFSKVIQTRPTFFIEVIQRYGAEGFGSRNIKALFEAIEEEQMIREKI